MLVHRGDKCPRTCLTEQALMIIVLWHFPNGGQKFRTLRLGLSVCPGSSESKDRYFGLLRRGRGGLFSDALGCRGVRLQAAPCSLRYRYSVARATPKVLRHGFGSMSLSISSASPWRCARRRRPCGDGQTLCRSSRCLPLQRRAFLGQFPLVFGQRPQDPNHHAANRS